MILTFKIRHNRDFTDELRKARQVAEYAIRHRSRSSADVKHIGLKGVISNQILRKYSCDKRAKKVNRVKLAVPGQSIKCDRERQEIFISLLKLTLPNQFRNDFEKINQIELDDKYAYVSITVPEPKTYKPKGWIGVDRNTTGHIAVASDPDTGKTWKLGKKGQHTHVKYGETRRRFQHKGKFGKLKEVKLREKRIVKDMNHKISRKIVSTAHEQVKGIKMEDLSGIRDRAKSSRGFRYSLHSWNFYQLQSMIEYKAKLLGVPVAYVDPAYTSQECSRCGLIGTRNGKSFKCPHCGHVDHADVNASFNIAERQIGVGRLHGERDSCNGSTDAPEGAPL